MNIFFIICLFYRKTSQLEILQVSSEEEDSEEDFSEEENNFYQPRKKTNVNKPNTRNNQKSSKSNKHDRHSFKYKPPDPYYKDPEKITKNNSKKSSNSNKHPNGVQSDNHDAHKVESYEEFYRRKSINLTDVEDMSGLQCPDCGQIFKTPMDSKRHFNLIHRTSKNQLEAKKRIQALKSKQSRPSRWGNATGSLKL